MAWKRTNVIRFSRDYRRPPKWNMGLPPRRPRSRWKLADPHFYLSAVIVIASVGLIILPGVADGTLAALRPATTESGACRIYQVVDGDTVRMFCPGRGTVAARLTGFDTPELFSPRCASELVAAMRAKWGLRQALWQVDELTLIREGTDRYGRALVAAYLDGVPLAQTMIANGYARRYTGGARQAWCA